MRLCLHFMQVVNVFQTSLLITQQGDISPWHLQRASMTWSLYSSHQSLQAHISPWSLSVSSDQGMSGDQTTPIYHGIPGGMFI